MADLTVEVFSKTIVALTFNIVDADGDAYVVTGYTVTLYVHDDDEEARGTNRIAAACSIEDGANGQVAVTLTETHTALDEANGEDHFQGVYQLCIDKGDSTDKDMTLPQRFIIRRNRMLAPA